VRASEDNQIPIPNRRYRKPTIRINADMNAITAVLDSLPSVLLQRQERVIHRVPVVPPRRVNCVDREDFKLDDFTHAEQPKPGP
jgi:hypothetical protein